MGFYAASALITFLLQTTVEWAVCLLLVRVARSPRTRFHLWLAMLLTAFLQWVWLWAGVARRALLTTVEVARPSTVSKTAHTLILNPGWGKRIATTLIALAICYVAVLFGLLVRSIWLRVRLSKALSYRVATSERLYQLFREVRLLTPFRDCQLWALPGLASPATFGWRRPQIIVPFECETQDNSELQAIFWHELTHIHRRDALWGAVVRFCRNLLWFHPCIHHAFTAINIERELACDRMVIEDYPVGRDTYAACLLRFARLKATSEISIPCIELTSGAAFLNLRVRSILSEIPEVTFASTLRRATAGVALIGALLTLMPGLRIVLTAISARPVLATFATHITTAATVRPNGHRIRASQKHADTASPLTAVSETNAGTTSISQSTNPALAASHRVGIGVLTQYGDGQGQAQRDDRDSDRDDLNPATRHGAVAQPSWTTVAIGAAERLGNIDLDHDHDRH